MTTATKPARTPGLPKADTRHESIELWYEDNFGNLWSATAPEIVPTGKMRRDPDRATIAALVAALRDTSAHLSMLMNQVREHDRADDFVHATADCRGAIARAMVALAAAEKA